MKTKLFIGFIFNKDQLFSQKIKNFRSRFDPKYDTNSFTHLGLVEPFEIENKNIEQLCEVLVEELETFYFEQKDSPIIEFKGIDFIHTKKRSLLSLMPVFNQEHEFLKELLLDICTELSPEEKIKNSKKFLTLGRYQTFLELNNSINHARLEFDSEQGRANSIGIFKQIGSHWEPFFQLIDFDEVHSSLLQPAFAKI